MAKRRHRPAEFDRHEAYFTPIPVGNQGLGTVNTMLEAHPEVVVDLGAGAGGLGQVARSLWPRARHVAVEIRESEVGHLLRHYDSVLIGDVRSCPIPQADMVISNPAFSLALDFAERAFDILRPGGIIVFLTRQTWGDAEEVENFLRGLSPLFELTISGRVSMAAAAEETKDNFGYQWLVWRPGLHHWCRRLLPRLDNASLGWTARPGTGPMLPLDPELLLDLGPLARQLLTAPANLPRLVDLLHHADQRGRHG